MAGYITVATKKCVVCGQAGEITLPVRSEELWRAGMHLQDAWPDSTPEEREMLISGTHPDCWDDLAPDDDSEELSVIILDDDPGDPGWRKP